MTKIENGVFKLSVPKSDNRRRKGPILAIGAGAVLMDHMTVVERLPKGENLPKPGQKLQGDPDFISQIIKSFEDVNHPAGRRKLKTQLGGPAITALSIYQDAAMNIGTMTFIGAVGGDEVGSKLIEKIVKKQVLPILDIQDDKRSGQSMIWVSEVTGARSILYDRGTLEPISEDFFLNAVGQIEAINKTIRPGKRILHLDASNPTLVKELASYFHGKDGLVYLDTGDFKEYGNDETTSDLIWYADVVQMPLRCAKQVYEFDQQRLNRPAKKLSLEDYARYFCRNYRRKGQSRLFVVTNGIEGAGFAYNEGKTISAGRVSGFTGRIEGFPDVVIDETSAGDIFAGAAGSCLVKGNDVITALKVATITAASSVRQLGNKEFLDRKTAMELSHQVELTLKRGRHIPTDLIVIR